MATLLLSGGRLLGALFLVALNGFLVASEFALVRVRSTAVDQMVEEGRAGAETLQAALGSLDDYLDATQLGITAEAAQKPHFSGRRKRVSLSRLRFESPIGPDVVGGTGCPSAPNTGTD
jgi:hypothetical protein